MAERCPVFCLDMVTLEGAMSIRDRYRFSWWDSLIVASALQAGCDELCTEDLQHGQIIDNRLSIVNPFLP
jgi:predicted nucleic acid-binding protein